MPNTEPDHEQDDDRAVLEQLLARHKLAIPTSPAMRRRRIQAREIEALCASPEAVGVQCGKERRRKLLVLTVARTPPAPPLAFAVLETEHSEPPSPRYVIRLLGELEGEATR